MIPFDGCEDKLAPIEREISLIEKAGCYSQAYLLQGMLAGLRGDSEMVHKKFTAALRASGNDRVIGINYAQALTNIRHLREAIDQINSVISRYPDDIDALDLALKIHMDAYDAIGAAKVIDTLARLGQGERIPSDTGDKIVYFRDLMEENGIQWEDVAERIELASDVLRSQGVSGPFVSEISSCHGVFMEFGLHGDLESAFHAEDAIHKAIANRPYSSADRFISFACAPL